MSANTSHRFFAAATGLLADDASEQDRLLRRMGRTRFTTWTSPIQPLLDMLN